MLEIYNYVIGILIGILFSFSNHNESTIIIIKNCLITTVIYAISMSFINDYFLLSSLLKLIYFTIYFYIVNARLFSIRCFRELWPFQDIASSEILLRRALSKHFPNFPPNKRPAQGNCPAPVFSR